MLLSKRKNNSRHQHCHTNRNFILWTNNASKSVKFAYPYASVIVYMYCCHENYDIYATNIPNFASTLFATWLNFTPKNTGPFSEISFPLRGASNFAPTRVALLASRPALGLLDRSGRSWPRTLGSAFLARNQWCGGLVRMCSELALFELTRHKCACK